MTTPGERVRGDAPIDMDTTFSDRTDIDIGTVAGEQICERDETRPRTLDTGDLEGLGPTGTELAEVHVHGDRLTANGTALASACHAERRATQTSSVWAGPALRHVGLSTSLASRAGAWRQ
jgi:hypothetical protein